MKNETQGQSERVMEMESLSDSEDLARDAIAFRNGRLRFATGEFTPGSFEPCLNGSYELAKTEVDSPLPSYFESILRCNRIDDFMEEDLDCEEAQRGAELFYRAIGGAIFTPEKPATIVHLCGDLSRHIVVDALIKAVSKLAVVVNETELHDFRRLSLPQAQRLSAARLIIVNISGKPSARAIDAILALPFTSEIATGLEIEEKTFPFTASVLVVSGSKAGEFPDIYDSEAYGQTGLAEFEACMDDFILEGLIRFRDGASKKAHSDELLRRVLEGARKSAALLARYREVCH